MVHSLKVKKKLFFIFKEQGYVHVSLNHNTYINFLDMSSNLQPKKFRASIYFYIFFLSKSKKKNYNSEFIKRNENEKKK